MWPILLDLGPIKVYSYGLMVAAGLLTAIVLVQRDAIARGMNPKVFSDMAFYVFVIGLISSRIAHIALYPRFYSWDDPKEWIAVWNGGLVFQGALLPAGIFAWWYLRRNGIRFLDAADIMFPYVPLGHAFGRVGCFLYGCCYGRPTDFFLGIPARRVPWDTSLPAHGSPAYMEYLETSGLDRMHAEHWSHPIHPTQLYSVLGLLTIFGLMLLMRKYWHPFNGFTFPMYLILYGVLRFVVEIFRGDHNPTAFWDLSQQQMFCVASFVLGIALFFYLYRRAGRLADEDVSANADQG